MGNLVVWLALGAGVGERTPKKNRLWSLSFRKAGLNWQLTDTHRCLHLAPCKYFKCPYK